MGLQPMWSFPSAACLGPNPDTLEKRNRGSWQREEGKKETEKHNDSCHMHTINSHHLCDKACISI